MADDLQKSVNQLDKDLSNSWMELSERVRTLAADLKLKTAGTEIGAEAEHLSTQAALLCDHVSKLHEDVTDLVENIETRVPLIGSEGAQPAKTAVDEIERETIQIQRESHELRNDFKDILKALFMWKDDPEERIKEKKS